MRISDFIILQIENGTFNPPFLNEVNNRINLTRILSANESTKRIPYIAFAFDTIKKDQDSWYHTNELELYSVSDIESTWAIPAIQDLEARMISELLKDDLANSYLTPNSWSLADTELYLPRVALPKIHTLGEQHKFILQQSIEMHLPTRASQVQAEDFFAAYSLGGNSSSLIEGIPFHYLHGSLFQGAEYLSFEVDEDGVSRFYEELRESFEWQDYEDWPKGKTPADVMESIVRFYNAFMKYREIIFVKNKLGNLKYELMNNRGLIV